jgi:uncharacterized membrane protein YhhN
LQPAIARALLSLAVSLSAGLTVSFDSLRPRRPWLFYIFKPLTTCLVLSVAVLFARDPRSTYAAAIVVGLVLSLAGDVWLMLPADRFIQGLASFLLAHLCYIVAFAAAIPYAGFPWAAMPLVFLGAGILGYLWPALTLRLRAPVSVYVTAIVAMASLAAYRASTSPSAAALSAAIGAILFLSSDAALAINRFRRPFRGAQAVVLGCYYAGQLLIALSAGL